MRAPTLAPTRDVKAGAEFMPQSRSARTKSTAITDVAANPAIRRLRDDDFDDVELAKPKRPKRSKPKAGLPWGMIGALGGGLAAILCVVGAFIFTLSRRADGIAAHAPQPVEANAKLPKKAEPPIEEPDMEDPAPGDPPVEILGLDLGFRVPVVSPEAQAKKRRDLTDYNRRTLMESYDKVGKKDAKWDADAQSAMEEAANMFSDKFRSKSSWHTVHPFAKRAVEAGCDDPLILYLRARSYLVINEENSRRIVAAGQAMEKSAYPVYRRVSALNYAADDQLRLVEWKAGDIGEAERLREAAVRLAAQWPQTDDDGKLRWKMQFEAALEAFKLRLRGNGGNVPAALEWIAGIAGKEREMEVAALKVRSWAMTEWGWQARGSGMAGTVSEEGWRLFGERLLESRKALEAAWQLNPADGHIAAMMILNCKAIGHGDLDETRLWFDRAMTADPDNSEACGQLLDYLDPKWHGSPEALVAFGRSCRDSGNLDSNIPLLVAQAHFRAIVREKPDVRVRYMSADRVWKDIQSVYEEYLSHRPGDEARRFEFAMYAATCSRYEIAGEHFLSVGDNVYNFLYTPLDDVRKIRDYAITFKRMRDGKLKP
jgi:hypothetical protein